MKVNTIFWLVISCCWLTACGLNKPSQGSLDDSKGAVTQKAQLSIVQKLKAFGHLPVGERISLYYKLKKESPEAYNFKNEDELTMYGYSFLWNNEVAEALAIFKLIVAEFPDSSNPYDSLGEAYLKNGDKELAMANYEKSLAMNPDNFNAEDQIERIKHPEKALEKPADKFAKVFTAQTYKADLDQLGNTLLKVHPNALKFISKEAFWKTIEEKKALVTDQTTYAAFAWHCSEIIANVHCSHTGMGSFYVENDLLPPALKFPLRTRWVNDQLFVVDPLNNGAQVKLKDEIWSINGVAVSKLLREVYQHIPSQGHIQTTKKHLFNRWSSCMIPYALGFPETYNIVLKGGKDPIVLNKAETLREPFVDPSIKRCETDLCLEMLEDGKTAMMTIATFNYYPWSDLTVFTKFIDSSFNIILQKGIQNLVIDVRFNGGGSQQSSIHLLRYLVDKPFIYYSNAQFEGKTAKIDGEEVIAPFENRFKGKCYFMIDGNGNSTTGHFMSLAKVLHLGTIVGEELGSNQFCSAGQKICRLANTKLEYYVANNTHESTATSLPDEVGILPDHTVVQSIEEYLNKVDAVKAYTLKLVQKQP